MRIADDESHGHGLAQGTAEAEHHPADDSNSGIRQHHVAHHLPGRAADAIRRFLEHRRDCLEDVARDRGHEWQDHNGEDQSGGEHADAVRRSGKQRRDPRHVAERFDQEWLQRLLQERREDEKSPNPVDDAGDAGEQLDGDADRPPQPLRAQLGEEECDHQSDRDRDQHGDERGDEGPVNRRQCAEFFGDRIPTIGGQESEAESPKRRQRPLDQCNDDAAQEQQHRDGGGPRQLAERGVAEPQTIEDFGVGPRMDRHHSSLPQG